MKILKYIGIALLICGILFAAAYFIKTNNKSVIEYETQSTIVTSIERKTCIRQKKYSFKIWPSPSCMEVL